MTIRPFEPRDQPAARRLILDGLGEHFGAIDETLNPDLDEIMAHYVRAGHLFVVAEVNGALAGTGALKSVAPGAGQLVRMSVRREQRRSGIGQALVEYLLGAARARGLAPDPVGGWRG
ncbi:MAG: GNAT family N-acetyltransferase [Chloroflexi bacterium]|nr:GNAT family N-acetyltransferase [Chloroflexota bacterium]MBI3734159.1 GNAT family N-acetyltransferase [Chloroflexota bacterium]